jgi:hypothetical protein
MRWWRGLFQILPSAPRPKRPATGPTERERLAEEWAALEEARTRIEEERRKLAEAWPEDVAPPFRWAPVIDWAQQPHVPAERIDWSKQGEPLRVRPTIGTLVATIGIIVSILSGGAYFYWGVRTHVNSTALHLTSDGVGWGVPIKFETRTEAQTGRVAILREVQKLREDQQQTLSEVRVISRKVARKGR